jgi:hypothetical protein
MPEPGDLHIDARLTNLSVQYRNEAMIWREVMPEIKVGKRSDKFTKYDREDAYRLVDDRVGPKSLPNEVSWGTSDDNYSVADHALSDWLPQETLDNSDNPIQPEVDTNDFLNMLLDVAQEKRVVDMVFNAASYPAANRVQLAGTAQWGGSADSPLEDVQNAVEECFMRANTLVFGEAAWRKFRTLPEVLDAVKSSSRFQGSPGGLATHGEVAGLFEVERVLVGRARYITSKEGQSPACTRLWGGHMAALHVVKDPGIRSITFGGTFVETRRQTQRTFDVKRGVKGAHFIKVAWNSDEVVIANDLGYFVQDAVA